MNKTNELAITFIMPATTRIYYPNIFRPRKDKFGNDQYSLCAVLDKSDPAVAALDKCIKDAYQKGRTLLAAGGTVPPLSELSSPMICDGDARRPYDHRFRGKVFLNVSSTEPTVVLNASRRPITDEREIHSGMVGHVILEVYAYNVRGNRGIKATLRSVQKLGDGDKGNAYTYADAIRALDTLTPENGTSPSIFPG